MAFHQGPVYPDSANGFAGTAVNETARLADGPLFKRALAAFPHAAVACIVSEGLYRDVVREEPDGIRRDRFREIRVSLPDKDFDEPAWIEVVGADVNEIDLEIPPVADAKSAAERPDGPGGVHTGDLTANGRSQIAVGDNATAAGKIRYGR